MGKKLIRIIVIIFVAGNLINVFFAQEYEQTSEAEEHSRSFGYGLDDPADLESFVDGIMAFQMKSRHIAGATFVVVKDGEIFLAKGYGYADLEKKRPVSAYRTLFRPGSVSKLFTWTAVVQLVERGKIDLNADVNLYLKIVFIAGIVRRIQSLLLI